MEPKKLLIVLNADWFFLSHRLAHAIAAQKEGYKVMVAAAETGVGNKIKELGFEFFPLQVERSGKNIMREVETFYQLLSLYRRRRPDIIHHFTWKPLLYGTMAGRIAGTPQIVNTVTGFGYLFIDRSRGSVLLSRILVLFLKVVLRSGKVKVIVQNENDYITFMKWNIVSPKRLVKINGAGVDLEEFRYIPEMIGGGAIKIALPARMIADKGIWEFVEAAQILKSDYGRKIEFLLAGDIDPENISSLNTDQLKEIEKQGNVKWLGFIEEMPSFIAKCHIIVLPSYREGLPKVLLETLSCGRPAVTTDVPGCRDVVENQMQGFLVNPYDSIALAGAIRILIEDRDKRVAMGINGRRKAENEFDVHMVVAQILQFYMQ